MTRSRASLPRTPEFSRALSLAREAAYEAQPKCVDKLSFVDYSTPPSKQEAKAMCAACPLLDLCGESARLERPAWGVRAGVVWVNGRRLHWGKGGAKAKPQKSLAEKS